MNYFDFLHKKLYLIECVARKGASKGDKEMKEILELCIASPSKIAEHFGEELQFD